MVGAAWARAIQTAGKLAVLLSVRLLYYIEPVYFLGCERERDTRGLT